MTTYNSGAHMRALLDNLRDFANVHIVDSGSTDETLQLCTLAGRTPVHHAYESQSSQLNWALDVVCREDWVLILDSDELLAFTYEDVAGMVAALTAADAWAGTFRRRNYAFGKWMKHGGWYPDRQVRLLRRDKCRYERVPVHAHVHCPPAKIRHFQADLIHHTYTQVDDYWQKAMSFTKHEASAPGSVYRHNARPGFGRLKTLSRTLPARPLLRFLYRYIVRRGFLDGWRGWHLALWSATYDDIVSARRRYDRAG